jgi:hypothetical protein
MKTRTTTTKKKRDHTIGRRSIQKVSPSIPRKQQRQNHRKAPIPVQSNPVCDAM